MSGQTLMPLEQPKKCSEDGLWSHAVPLDLHLQLTWLTREHFRTKNIKDLTSSQRLPWLRTTLQFMTSSRQPSSSSSTRLETTQKRLRNHLCIVSSSLWTPATKLIETHGMVLIHSTQSTQLMARSLTQWTTTPTIRIERILSLSTEFKSISWVFHPSISI